MPVRYVIAATAVAAIVCALIAASIAFAAGDGEWFKSLKMPDTGASCCDVSDCHKAESEWRDGQWWVVIDDKWQPVPPGKVLQQSSIYEDAVVCSAPRSSIPGSDPVIYCFAPRPYGF